MNATFTFENEIQAERFGKELGKRFINSIPYRNMVEVYNYSFLENQCKNLIHAIAREHCMGVITDASAVERLQQMTLQECIDLWNEYLDQFHQLSYIKPMEDEDWWNHLAKELGAWDMMHFVQNSGADFNDADMHFAYIEDNCTFFSFSTKQELVEYTGEQFFIDILDNLE